MPSITTATAVIAMRSAHWNFKDLSLTDRTIANRMIELSVGMNSLICLFIPRIRRERKDELDALIKENPTAANAARKVINDMNGVGN